MSDPKILPDITNDEVEDQPDDRRDAEIAAEKPPHY
jgi:hypothetical protein